LAARALSFEQPFPDRSFDLVVAAGWIEPLPSPARTLVELKRVSSRHVLVIVAEGAEPLDEERLAGLIAAAGLRLRKTRRGPPGLLGALAERPD
jgi:ubiquinone/menaquinone biosynthesis C-methylase UbiE